MWQRIRAGIANKNLFRCGRATNRKPAQRLTTKNPLCSGFFWGELSVRLPASLNLLNSGCQTVVVGVLTGVFCVKVARVAF